jgi:hypothetical protein
MVAASRSVDHGMTEENVMKTRDTNDDKSRIKKLTLSRDSIKNLSVRSSLSGGAIATAKCQVTVLCGTSHNFSCTV